MMQTDLQVKKKSAAKCNDTAAAKCQDQTSFKMKKDANKTKGYRLQKKEMNGDGKIQCNGNVRHENKSGVGL